MVGKLRVDPRKAHLLHTSLFETHGNGLRGARCSTIGMSVGVPSLRPASEGLRVSSAFASIPGFEIPCFECEVSKRCATEDPDRKTPA